MSGQGGFTQNPSQTFGFGLSNQPKPPSQAQGNPFGGFAQNTQPQTTAPPTSTGTGMGTGTASGPNPPSVGFPFAPPSTTTNICASGQPANTTQAAHNAFTASVVPSFGGTAPTQPQQPSLTQTTAPEPQVPAIELKTDQATKVLSFLENSYNTLCAHRDLFSQQVSLVTQQEEGIARAQHEFEALQARIDVIQQQQRGAGEALAALYDIQCGVFEHLKQLEAGNSSYPCPLTQALTQIENRLIDFERSMSSSSYISTEAAEVYQGIVQQVRLLGILEAHLGKRGPRF
ncbi:hypothetical protein GMRT_10118 [Giardia muris]|uniref:Uncharacterized protein n=1 Tax=Giardia muris TaxID=5742 RepID=A0A4Z1SW31_GIAMU|nr:hypothetical protein GMRT_10118 [Giardia muris]|eukprot:TNJ27768.1 hypothetical protein GMRT_10118 [Giardia muris]